MNAPTPWTGFGTLRKEMDRLFERFGDWEPSEMTTLGEWMPTVDVSENKEAFVVKAEVPGIESSDISVSLENQMLTIMGEKKHEQEERDEHYYRMERGYGTFARSIRLPAPVDAGKVNAAFKNGLLTVTLPKTAGAKGNIIPVKSE
jgi:HSP20 family protein